MADGPVTPFSRRHGYRAPDREITVRQDAPGDLRYAVIQIAGELGILPQFLRSVICRVLYRRPQTEVNWSDGPVLQEVYGYIENCEWFRVYDIIEALYRDVLHEHLQGSVAAPEFEARINQFFGEEGIGWQLANGEIRVRGDEAFEATLRAAGETLADAGLATASNEIRQAIRDLSGRPAPDITGAIQHAAAAFECVARQATGDQQATLGKIMNDYPDLVPRPLNEAVPKIYGFTSEMGRHLREGREPGFVEAELVVGLSASLATYLAKRLQGQ